ncbi:MAG: MBL fold metallo-hydrolase [Bdellovibrio sp. CG12_big_fil_rev_8_21_14_0_65_39_13]|nr:MAG: MBL fold metallo-hydrolase [Bdellovibrio sp. CG22_combo_CG10-13_8_21_14_all_39_27]PIQ61040.1 MAG: MBL fold metallo-hydrolase [Bdellovibrio sp. CG12_big_fil_rev_8_21_14_0_65_39_13]PIR36807.1 MAG: MBL fold metallo-hydrolase [Bdellovibrio sp. CG11_big_fil_rev_8_21_14_0_20_39_38]
MAQAKLKHPQNVSGQFFVDTTCIDCGTCYWMAPQTFRENTDQSTVYHQPESDEDQKRSYQALLSCPTSSIGVEKRPDWSQEILNSFPHLIEQNVFHCGFHAESSYGAASYFIQDPRGNILIDSPRFFPHLVKAFEKLGGIRYQYLTHKDDIADTDKYYEHFKSERIIHLDDTNSKTKNYEIILKGQDNFKLYEDAIIIPVPGHTKGHTTLLYKDHFLFTGDHLAYSNKNKQLIAFKNACWYDFTVQINSMEKLQNYSFSQILPGHGAPFYAPPQKMIVEMQNCIEWMKS